MRILGIDPSLSGTGLVVIEDVIGSEPLIVTRTTAKTSPGVPQGERLSTITGTLTSLMGMYQPDHVAIEGYAMGAKFQREVMGEVGGAIKLALWGYGVDPITWAPGSWRKALFNNGSLKKDRIQIEAFQRYGVDLKDTNQLEAFCVARAEFAAQSGAPRPRPKKSRKVSTATCGSCGSAGLCDCTVSLT